MLAVIACKMKANKELTKAFYVPIGLGKSSVSWSIIFKSWHHDSPTGGNQELADALLKLVVI